ncbi:hypothetical protein ACFFU1_05635 [Algibacter miyuki]|uniref:Uncharacterized protein n=2 Tax=Algibacter miyuki TaxID=1306933 RepID=A0ABV5GXK6_9FLAO|nr:hypothetical protein [Algibacter miyuki]
MPLEIALMISIRSSIKYIELLVAIIGTIYLFKYKHTYLKYFLVILWYTAINEFSGYLFRILGFSTNMIIYNVFHFINFSFLFLLFNRSLEIPKYKKATSIFLGIYVASFFINMFFENYLIEVQTVPFLIASVLLITSIVFYFSEILNTEEVLYVKNNMLFWISVGYLLYLSGNIPIRVIRNYFADVVSLENVLEISSVLSIVMNMCFIIGFVWGEKDKGKL